MIDDPPNGTAILLMSLAEARAVTEQIKSNLTQTRALLLEMYERQGWQVLGYESWRAYGQEEFGYSETHIYRLMDAAKVERDISPIGENGSVIPESHLRPFASIPSDLRAELWQTAIQTAPNGRVTAAHVESVVDVYKHPREYPRELINKTPHVSHNSGNNEWYTPPGFTYAARVVMGGIDLDPASSAEANQPIGATRFYSIEDDGLSQDWHGRIWLNPPYADGLVEKFINKLIYHYKNKTVSEAIVLVNNASETVWFQALANAGVAICFPKARIKFWKSGGEKGSPLQGQAIVYLGDNPRLFHQEFKAFGFMVEIV